MNRSSLYYKKSNKKSGTELEDLIIGIYLKHPFYGYRRITETLKRNGLQINRKRVRSIMQDLNIRAIYPKLNLSVPNKQHKKYPYLLSGMCINQVNQVWSSDITYLHLKRGVVYLAVVIDIFSRKILSWKLSNTLDRSFCIDALNDALLQYGNPGIFNTDQGSQFTSNDYTKILRDANIKISMNGKGRALDNIFIERTFRSLKYEEVYLKDYENVNECRWAIKSYFRFFNQERVHQSLNYKTPDEVFNEDKKLLVAS